MQIHGIDGTNGINGIFCQMDAGKIKSISGSVKFSLFLNSNNCLSITFPIFDKQKWFCTFYNAMAIEKTNLCFDTRFGEDICTCGSKYIFVSLIFRQSFSLDTLCSASKGMSSCLIQDLWKIFSPAFWLGDGSRMW